MNGRDLSQDAPALRAALEATQTIAVVGASPHRERAAFGVMRYMQGRGYRCLPVNPEYPEVLGEKTVGSLAELASPVEMIDVFRNLRFIPALVDEILALSWQPKLVFFQEGLKDAKSAQRLMDAGIDVAQDRCLYKEHWKLIGYHAPLPDKA